MTVFTVEVEGCKCCEWRWEGLLGIYTSEEIALEALKEWARSTNGEYVGTFDSPSDIRDRWESALADGSLGEASGRGPGLYWEATDWVGLVESERTMYAARAHVRAYVRLFEILDRPLLVPDRKERGT